MSGARLLFLIMVAVSASRSWSQTVPDGPDRYRTDVAGSRDQPVFDALGARLGSFVARADGVVEVGYSSNIFARSTDVIGDSFVSVAPSLQLGSDWGRHAAQVSMSADLTRFARLNRQDTNDYRLNGGGLIELGDRIKLRPTLNYAREAEPRGSVGNRFTIGDPLYQRLLAASLGVNYDGGRFSAEALVAVRRERYEALRIGDSLQSQRLRDTDGFGGRATLLYRLTPAVSGLVQAVADRSSNPHPEFCCLRSAHGYALLAGVRVDPSGTIAGQVAVGYRHRTFEGSRLSSSGLTYDVRGQWYPTELVTVTVNANQQNRTSGIATADTVLVSTQRLAVAYEMYRDLNFSIEAGREASNYHAADTRTELKSISIRGTYTARRAIQIAGFMRYQLSNTSRPAVASGYDALRFGLSIRGRI